MGMSVESMISCMIVVVSFLRSRVLMRVAVFVQMLVRMGVGMLVAVFLAAMPMLVAVGVSMLMSMQMFVFVVAMHGGTPFVTILLDFGSAECVFLSLSKA
jgi:hypothetical protein